MSTPAASSRNWLRHPLAQALLRFNLLPSTFLHAEREDALAAHPKLQSLPTLHRHRSAALLKEHGLDPVVGLDDPALPLAMLPPAHFDRLLLLMGAALNAPHIRRTIRRDELALLREQLGTEGLAAARMPAATALAGLPIAPDWANPRAATICSAWGGAILGQAFEAGSQAVARRGHLRLAPQSDALRAPLAAAGLEPGRALGIARELLLTLEPAWMSSFQTTH